MDYLFYHSGKIPNYLKYSLESVKKSDTDANIFLACDQEYQQPGVEVVDINKLNSSRIEKIKNLRYFKGWSDNPLWESSLLRIFYLYEVAKFLKIDQFVHFDNDVILYKPFTEIKNLLTNQKLNITPLTNSFLVFGYSFVNSLSIYDEICEKVFEIYNSPDRYEKQYYEGKKIIEMKALYIAYKENPNLFNLLPVHPKDSENYVFDPASYGQYLSGVHNKRFSRKFTDETHILGSDLKNKYLVPSFKKKKVTVNFKDKDYQLVNLHIHSKKLRKYL